MAAAEQFLPYFGGPAYFPLARRLQLSTRCDRVVVLGERLGSTNGRRREKAVAGGGSASRVRLVRPIGCQRSSRLLPRGIISRGSIGRIINGARIVRDDVWLSGVCTGSQRCGHLRYRRPPSHRQSESYRINQHNSRKPMTSYTWNGVSGDWNLASDWTPSGGPPTA